MNERSCMHPVGGDSGSDAICVGVADHLGWAVTIAVSFDLIVVDRRRIEMVGPDLPPAPMHHLGGPHEMHRTGDPLDDAELAAIVQRVRRSAATVIGHELDRLAADLPGPIATVAMRAWPADFPIDISMQRRVPYESRADPVMYRMTLAAAAVDRGWKVTYFDAKTVTASALARLGAVDDQLLREPGKRLGPPWGSDQRLAFAAAIAASPLPPAKAT